MAREKEYWDTKVETLDRDKQRERQFEMLKPILEHAYSNSIFYKRKFDEARIKPKGIQTLDDFFGKVPLIKKPDIIEFLPMTS